MQSTGDNEVNRKIPLSAIVVAGILSACGSEPSAGPRVDVTIGQQLIELKEAHESGALTDKEYARQKKQLINNLK